MRNHGHRGVLSFRIQISPLCSECPVPCPPPSELSSHALCVSSRSSPFAVSHHQHHRHHPHHHHDHHHHHPHHHHPHHHHHSTCKSDFSTSICPVSNGAMKVTGSSIHRYRKSFGWTEIFPSFCQSGDLLAHDVHIDKPKAWCQQKRARSHVGSRTEWSPASPVTQLPFVSPLLKSKCMRHLSFWALLEVAICDVEKMPLWRQAYFEVKMYKTHQLRDVEKVNAAVARSTSRSQKCKKLTGTEHFSTLRCRKSARRCGAKHISKSTC